MQNLPVLLTISSIIFFFVGIFTLDNYTKLFTSSTYLKLFALVIVIGFPVVIALILYRTHASSTVIPIVTGVSCFAYICICIYLLMIFKKQGKQEEKERV